MSAKENIVNFQLTSFSTTHEANSYFNFSTTSMYPSTSGLETGVAEDPSQNESIADPGISTEALVEYYINGVFGIIVIILGMIGNSLTVLVLTKKTMHSSTNCFLAALAVWDIMVLIGSALLISLPRLSSDYEAVIFPYIVVYVYPFVLVAQTSTLWITVSFTVERYIAVCHPLRAASMCTINRARIVIASVSVVSFLYNLCRWFEYEVVPVETRQSNQTVVSNSYSFTPLGANGDFRKVYFFYLYPFVMFIIPLSTLAVLNLFLILAVRKSQQQQKNMNVRQSRENNVTIMLVSVVMVFILCQVPALVYNVAYSIDYETVSRGFSWMILSSIRNFLATFNSAINFILYCAFGQKFRRIFIKTFCTCLIDENDYNSYLYHGTVAVSSDTTSRTMGKYKKLFARHVRAKDAMELSSNMTGHSLLSKYSPNCKRSPSPDTRRILAKYQNGRYNTNQKRVDRLRDPYDTDKLHGSRMTLNSSRTPSPV